MKDRPEIDLLTSPSPGVLERALVRRVRELVRGSRDGAAPRIAIVVPTLVLAQRVQRALARDAGAAGVVAGVEVLHHRSLAARLLELAFLRGLRDAPPRILTGMEEDALVRGALETLPARSTLRKLAVDRPRVVTSLARTIAELREAIVEPADLSRALGPKDDLARAYAAHVASLVELERTSNATDRAGHALAAARAARSLEGRAPWAHVVHHGSYELVGSQAELLRAIGEHAPITVLAPCGEGPAHASARRALARWPGVAPTALDGEPLLDIAALFDEAATDVPGPGRRAVRLPAPLDGAARIEAIHCRGTRAELEAAARLAAEAHLERGVPLEDIGVVARSLEPFAGHLEAAFTSHGVPFTTTARAPLLREPWAQAMATLMKVLAEDLPRAAVAELLRSASVQLGDKVKDRARIAPDLWDRWTLKARVVRGVNGLSVDVLAWHHEELADRARRNGQALDDLASEPSMLDRRAQVETLGEVARALQADAIAWNACRTHGEHAAFLRDVAARWLVVPGSEQAGARRARQAVHAALDDLARLSVLPLPESARPVGVAQARALLDTAMAGARLPIGEQDGSGVRVLGAMPARSLPLREVILVGLNQGFPRRGRQDPFLDDASREKLRAKAPALALQSEAMDDERQILALLLAAPSERLAVSWQRADDDGKARSSSLFLREIARIALGRPHLDAITRREQGKDPHADALVPVLALPGHPAEAARALRERTGRATFRDGALEASERVHRRRGIEALARATGRLDDGLVAGLAKVQLVDAFGVESDPARRIEQLAHDGLLGRGRFVRPDRLSATSLEMLGRCSLRWLFEREMRVEALDDEPSEGAVSAKELGTLVHAILEDVGRAAIARGGDPAWLASREARALLAKRWTAHVAKLAGARLGHAPVAWDALSARWLARLEALLVEDAARLSAAGARIAGVEEELDASVDVGTSSGPVTWHMRGRVDRILETPDGWQVEDYKAAADVGGHVAPADVLKGHALQGLSYHLLASGWAAQHPREGLGEPAISVAFLPVHPDGVDFEPRLLAVVAQQEPSWRETLGVLDVILQEGSFAFKPHGCDWCAIAAACRRHHVPTQERLRHVEELRDYLDLDRKSTRALDLPAVRARRGSGRPDDGEKP